jgi:molybdopterin-guanine dinucleotide biosynthesis protein A
MSQNNPSMPTQAVILVGGLGTRLGDRTKLVPKPMLDIGGRPFLDTLIDELVRYGVFDEILLLAGHKAEIVETHYAAAARGQARIVVSRETEPLGTGGALVHARNLLHDQFLLLNGDSLFDFNLLDLIARAQGGCVHMALRDGVVGDRYGRVVLDGDLVRDFIAPGAGATGPVNAGIYVVDKSVLADIATLPASLEQDVFPGCPELRDGYYWANDKPGLGIDLDEKLAAAGIPAAQLRDIRGLIEHPQVTARDRWREVETEAGMVRGLLPPMNFRDVELPMRPVPALGQHTDTVLAGLGLTDEQIRGLRDAGIVG